MTQYDHLNMAPCTYTTAADLSKHIYPRNFVLTQRAAECTKLHSKFLQRSPTYFSVKMDLKKCDYSVVFTRETTAFKASKTDTTVH